MLPRNQRTQCETKLYLGTVNYILNFPVNQILIERIQAINKINKTAAYALKTEFLFLITMERNSESWLNKYILKQKMNSLRKKENKNKQKKNSKIFIFIFFLSINLTRLEFLSRVVLLEYIENGDRILFEDLSSDLRSKYTLDRYL